MLAHPHSPAHSLECWSVWTNSQEERKDSPLFPVLSSLSLFTLLFPTPLLRACPVLFLLFPASDTATRHFFPSFHSIPTPLLSPLPSLFHVVHLSISHSLSPLQSSFHFPTLYIYHSFSPWLVHGPFTWSSPCSSLCRPPPFSGLVSSCAQTRPLPLRTSGNETSLKITLRFDTPRHRSRLGVSPRPAKTTFLSSPE